MPARSTRSTSLPNRAFCSLCVVTSSKRGQYVPGENLTSGWMRLASSKSTRSVEPRMAGSVKFHRQQYSACCSGDFRILTAVTPVSSPQPSPVYPEHFEGAIRPRLGTLVTSISPTHASQQMAGPVKRLGFGWYQTHRRPPGQ